MGAGENTTSVVTTFTVSRMDPSDVLNLASEFVIQYYTVMRKCPSGLHRFYKDDSAMIHENSTVFGQKLIHDKIMSMDFQNSRVGILRLDALRANGNSVLIQVSGEISVGGGDFRRFMQSFVLCEQAPCDFYVLNDIFRYQDHVYGDVKTVENSEQRLAEPEHLVGLSSEDVSRLQSSRVEPEVRSSLGISRQQGVVTWDNSTAADLSYVKSEGAIESHGGSHIEVREPEAPHEKHIPMRSPPSPHNVGSDLPDEALHTPPAAPQPCTWAQMASKQPAHAVMNVQTSKFSKVASHGTVHPSFDESSKINRQASIGGATAMTQRPRGAGGRSQPIPDGRAASGDHGFQQDNRPSGQGPMRASTGRGGSTGMRGGGRGGRGGFGHPSLGGRGTSAPFPRRGQ
ncbi:nuclear transport factor 2 domain protein, partial [Opisthorchis viverrini]